MTTVPKLTKSVIETTPYAGGTHYLWSSTMTGFGVRIYPSGRRSFVISYSTRSGRDRIQILGQVGRLTLDKAERLARQVFADVAEGRDPLAERRTLRRKTVEAPTVQHLYERYMREHARPHKSPKSVEEDERLWKKHVLPRIGKLPVPEVNRSRLGSLHVAIGHEEAKPVAANRVLAVLSKAFNLAEEWGWRDPNTNPTRGIARFDEVARERSFSEDEIQRFGQALLRTETRDRLSPGAVLALWLLLLTGARPSEVTSLRWDWFRPEDRCFVLPSAKGDRRGARRKGRVLPLPQKAIELLSQVLRSSRDPFVCPGAQPGTHLTTLDKAFALVCRLAGIENATPYALRHTFVSRGKRAGVAVREMSELAGHSDPTMTLSVYDHVDLDDLRAGAEAMGSYFERIIFKAPSTDDQSLETQPEPTGGLPVPA